MNWKKIQKKSGLHRRINRPKMSQQEVDTDGGASWLKDKRISNSTRRTCKCKVSMMIKVTYTPRHSHLHSIPFLPTFHTIPTYIPYHSYLHSIPFLPTFHTIPTYIPYHSYLHSMPLSFLICRLFHLASSPPAPRKELQCVSTL